MHVLSGKEVADQVAALRQELATRILWYIGISQPCHPLHLRRQVVAWFPSDAGQQELSRIEGILRWFEERGDIFAGPRGVLQCMPTYCICDDGALTATLFGNPHFDPEISEILNRKGGRLFSAPTQNRDGLVRHIELPAGGRQSVVDDLQAMGLRFFRPLDLLSRVDKVEDLELPGPEHFGPPSLVAGTWQHYDPAAPAGFQGGRWVPLEDWGAAGILVRWAPQSAEGKPWLRRFFLHMDGELVMEVPRDTSRWWQFALDDQRDRPTVWTYFQQSEELLVGGPLPQAVGQILQVLSTHPVTFDRFDRIYRIKTTQLLAVRKLGEEHLRVRITVKTIRPSEGLGDV